MKRILSLILVFSLVLCAALPVMAQATGIEDSATASSESLPGEVPESGSAPEDSSAPLGESSGEEPLPPTTPIQPEVPDAADLPEGIDLEDTVQTLLPDGGVIMPMSGWTGDDSEFFTRIRILISDSETGQPIQGAVYALYRSDGTFIEYLTTDYYGTATSGDVSVYYDYYLEEYSTPEGYRPNEERKNIILTEECAPSRVDVYAEYDPIYGYIKVIKTDEDGNTMSGVSFDVYRYDDWSYMETITTDWDGTAETGSLRYGWYELVEDTPEGYSGNGSYSAFVEYDGETTLVEITNYYARGSLRIYKYGTDGRTIQGAVFSIYRIPHTEQNAASLQALDLGGEWLMDITTNGHGYAYAYDLLAGYDYYAVEKSVPAPYLLDTETVHEFTISYSDQYVYLDVENEVDGAPGTVTVVKTDDNANPLDGVVFGLYRAWDNKRLETLTTANGGQAQSSALIRGDYYLIEEQGVEGYTPVTGQIPFTIDGEGTAVVKTVVNPKIRVFGKVEVIKVDDAGNPIPGVTFGIYCVAADKLLGELVTGEDGTAVSGVLNAGDYYLLERCCDAIEGYIISTERHPFTIDTDGEIVRVTVVNPRVSGAVKVIKTGDGGEALPGVVFGIFKDGEEIEQLTTGEDGTATSGTLYYGSGYELRELFTVDGYELLDTPIPFSILEQNVVLEIPVTNPLIMGGVTVIKISEPDAQEPQIVLYSENSEDDSNVYLAGAVFGLYNAQGQKLAELVTGEDGRAVYEGLPKGLYYLLELVAPEGHVLSGDMIAFRIDEQGQMVEKIVSNSTGFGVLELYKTGEAEEPLTGAVFEVYRTSTGEKVGEITTGEDGKESIELPLGAYSLVETVTAPGYALLSGSISFALMVDGEAVELAVQNQRTPGGTGKIRLIKVDAADKTEKLPGATFGIYRKADEVLVGEITTDADGVAVSLPLPEDEYYLYEHKAPAGFASNEKRYPFAIAADEVYEVTVANDRLPSQMGVLKIVKKNNNDKPLAGAVFYIYDADDDKKVGEMTTGRNGIATLELPEGSYYCREHKAPEGYRLSDEKVSFLLKTGQTKELAIINDKLTDPPATGNLQIIKSAAGTGERLEGAVFGVYRNGSSTKIAELTTDAGGNASLELERGDYTLRELRAPRGFVAEKTAIPFSITSEDAVVKIEVTNTTGVGTLRLTKAGPDGKAIAGAVFTVYDWNDRRITDIKTGGDGTVVYELPAGPHYLVEKSVPSPYVLSAEEHVFVIEAGKRTDLKVVNEVEKTPNPTPTPAPSQPTPAQPGDPGPSTGITIPKTGSGIPMMRYMLQMLCLAAAAVSGGMLYRMRRRDRKTQS